MSKRTGVWVAVGAALVVAIVIAGFYSQRAKTPPAPTIASMSASPGAPVSSSSSSSSSASSPSAGNQPAQGGQSAEGGRVNGSGPSSGTSTKRQQNTAGIVAPVSDPSKKLGPIGAPPQTIAMIGPSGAATGTELDVKFVPYGFGPGGAGQSVAVRLSSVRVVRGTRPKISLEGRNVLLFIAPGGKVDLVNGGTYSGKVVTVSQGSAVILQLREAFPTGAQ